MAALPQQDITDKLGSIIAKQKKRGISDPFPVFDVTDFMPNWCGATNDKKTMDMGIWLASYQSFALAAHAAGMWNYTAAYMHMRNCMQIMVEARQESKSWKLAVLYDELVRKGWSEKAARGMSPFYWSRPLLCRFHDYAARRSQFRRQLGIPE